MPTKCNQESNECWPEIHTHQLLCRLQEYFTDIVNLEYLQGSQDFLKSGFLPSLPLYK